MPEERHDRTELRILRVEERTKEQREHELDKQDRRVPDDGAEGHDRDTDERARRLVAVAVGERLDEHVADDEEDGHDGGENDLREDDRAPSCTRSVTREFLRGVAQALLLVASDHGARQAAVANPRV